MVKNKYNTKKLKEMIKISRDGMIVVTIDNDMIIQEKGERFTALIECEGINYYLMSEAESSVDILAIRYTNLKEDILNSVSGVVNAIAYTR